MWIEILAYAVIAAFAAAAISVVGLWCWLAVAQAAASARPADPAPRQAAGLHRLRGAG